MRAAKDYFSQAGYEVQDVARGRRGVGHNGYDLLISRGPETTKVEVKGCSREWHIPDLYSTEFDADRRLVADLLCVVYVLAGQAVPRICIIPREAIPADVVVPKSGYRIRSRFKNRDVLEKYCVTRPTPPAPENMV